MKKYNKNKFKGSYAIKNCTNWNKVATFQNHLFSWEKTTYFKSGVKGKILPMNSYIFDRGRKIISSYVLDIR